MITFIGNMLLTSIICGLLFLIVLAISPLFDKYTKRWRYIVFLALAIKLIIPLEVFSLPGAISLEIGASNNVVKNESIQHADDNVNENAYVEDEANVQMSEEKVQINETNVQMNQANVQMNEEKVQAGEENLQNQVVSQQVSQNQGTQIKSVETVASEHIMSNLVNKLFANIEIILMCLFVVWVVVAIAKIAIYISMYQYHRYSINRWSTPVKDEKVLEIFEEEKKLIGVEKNVEIKRCRKINTPMTVGFVHLRVLVPIIREDYEELRYVLRHELIHIKRRDMITKFVFVVAKSIHWFNPLVHKLAKRAYEDMELLCDDEVVKSMEYDEKIRYNEALIDVARKQVLYDDVANIVFSFGLVQEKNDLKERLLNIMKPGNRKKGYIVAAVMSIMIVCGASMISCALPKLNEGKNDSAMANVIKELEKISGEKVNYSESVMHKITEDEAPKQKKKVKKLAKKIANDEEILNELLFTYAYGKTHLMKDYMSDVASYEKGKMLMINYIISALDETTYDDDEIEIKEENGVKHARVSERFARAMSSALPYTIDVNLITGDIGYVEDYGLDEMSYYDLTYQKLPESKVSVVNYEVIEETVEDYDGSVYYNYYIDIDIVDKNAKKDEAGVYSMRIGYNSNMFGFDIESVEFTKQ